VNGLNECGVSFAQISFLYGILSCHQNLATVKRHDEIVFELTRRQPADRLRLVCFDEAALGMPELRRALAEYAPVHILFTGAGSTGYTPEAKQYCLAARIGLYNSSEINGALWRDEFWAYSKVDTAGAPVYCYKQA
jgi:hypothetical protein